MSPTMVSHVAQRGLYPRTDAAKAARDFTGATLCGWDMDPLRDVVELVVSELVANALSHGLAEHGTNGRSSDGPPVELVLMSGFPHVTCVVTDPSEDIPVLRDLEDLAESGRGLQLVSSCSQTWGWSHLAGGGKAVWALFNREADTP